MLGGKRGREEKGKKGLFLDKGDQAVAHRKRSFTRLHSQSVAAWWEGES